MSEGSERIAVDEAAQLVRQAIAGGRLRDDAPSLLFHHLDRMRGRFAELVDCFPPALHAVAIKANPLLEVLRALVGAGAGLEAASLGEVELALAAGCPVDRIVFDSPAKTISELRVALFHGVRINADNLVELARIAELRAANPSASRIGLRINPMVGAGKIAAMSVATVTSKFGVPLDWHRDEILAACARHPWLKALHVHTGSQGSPLELLAAGVRRVHELALEVNEHTPGRVDTLDVGGGLSAQFRADDPAASFAEYAQVLRDTVPGLFDGSLQLITEFGRAIQAPCGFAVSRVEYAKELGDLHLVVIHLGADLFLRRAYAPEHWWHDFVPLDASGFPKDGAQVPTKITGPLCFSGDTLAERMPLAPLLPGDLLLIRDAGAYTASMWSRYNSRAMPEILGVEAGQFLVLRRQETPEDLVSFWSRDP